MFWFLVSGDLCDLVNLRVGFVSLWIYVVVCVVEVDVIVVGRGLGIVLFLLFDVLCIGGGSNMSGPTSIQSQATKDDHMLDAIPNVVSWLL